MNHAKSCHSLTAIKVCIEVFLSSENAKNVKFGRNLPPSVVVTRISQINYFPQQCQKTQNFL